MLSSVFFQASEDFLFFIHGLLRKAIKVKSSSKKRREKRKTRPRFVLTVAHNTAQAKNSFAHIPFSSSTL